MKLNKNLVLLTLFVVILFSVYVSFIRDKEIFIIEYMERIDHILRITVILIFFITIIIYLYNKNPIAHVYY